MKSARFLSRALFFILSGLFNYIRKLFSRFLLCFLDFFFCPLFMAVPAPMNFTSARMFFSAHTIRFLFYKLYSLICLSYNTINMIQIQEIYMSSYGWPFSLRKERNSLVDGRAFRPPNARQFNAPTADERSRQRSSGRPFERKWQNAP